MDNFTGNYKQCLILVINVPRAYKIMRMHITIGYSENVIHHSQNLIVLNLTVRYTSIIVSIVLNVRSTSKSYLQLTALLSDFIR
jgi:hypothetical protein